MLLALEQRDDPGQTISTTQDQLIRMCRIPIAVFLNDVRTLVGNALDADDAKTTTDKSDPERVWMTTRKKEFKVWKKLERPLTWGDMTSDPYWMLARIVCRKRGEYSQGLPHSVTGSCSPRDFVDKLYSGSTAATMNGVRSPLWSRGLAWSAFRTCIAQCIFRVSPAATPAEAEEDIKNALETCVREAGINFFPDLTERRQRDPTPGGWTLIGLPNSARTNLNAGAAMSHEERMDLKLMQTAKAARTRDKNAAWSTKTTSLDEYHQFVSHDSLPVDFDLSDATNAVDDELTIKWYDWAKKFLASHPGDWRGRLARHLAFLIAKMAPNVFWPTGGTPQVRERLKALGDRAPEETIGMFRELEWMQRDNVKGFSPSLYFSQAVVVFLCWIHEDSPLRKHVEAHSGEGMTVWHKKHC